MCTDHRKPEPRLLLLVESRVSSGFLQNRADRRLFDGDLDLKHPSAPNPAADLIISDYQKILVRQFAGNTAALPRNGRPSLADCLCVILLLPRRA